MSTWRASRAALVLASSAILLVLAALAADAAYPGDNGQILFQRFQVGGPPGANGSFWEMDPDAGSEHRVTPAAPRDRGPVWSPDGSRFAFIRIKNRGSADRLATLQLVGMHAGGNDLPHGGPARRPSTDGDACRREPPPNGREVRDLPLGAADVVARREPDRRERIR